MTTRLHTPIRKLLILAIVTFIGVAPAKAIECSASEMRAPGVQSPYYARFGVTALRDFGRTESHAIVAPHSNQNIFPELVIQLGYEVETNPNPTESGNITEVEQEISVNYNPLIGQYDVDITSELSPLVTTSARQGTPFFLQAVEVTPFFGTIFYTPTTKVLSVQCR